jgi:hypothetical protein
MSDQRPGDRMKMARFAAMLGAYGSAPRRWPATERAAAEALLAASPAARALLAEAAQLDQALSTATAPAPSAALRAAILRAAPKPAMAERPGFAQTGRGLWQSLAGALTRELGGLRPAGALLGLALLLGIVAGGAVESQTGSSPSTASAPTLDLVQLALFDDSYGEF